MPGAGHGGHIVQQVAFGLLHRAEVGDHLAGLHDHLAQQQRAGANDLADHAHDPGEGVDLGQVAAVGAQFLPDVGNGVQADDVHAPVAEEEHVLRHIVEHHGVGIVQIPLIGVEGGHDHLARLLAVGEVAGGGGGKDLGHGLLVFLRDGPVVKKEIPLLIFRVAGLGPPRPGVLLAGVVHHEIQADGDAPPVAVLRQRRQVLHIPQIGAHPPEVRDGVAAVAVFGGAVQQRHEMEIVHAAVGDIVQTLLHAPQGAREGVHIHLHPHQIVSFVPAGIRLPLPVQPAQGFRPLPPHAQQHFRKIPESSLVSVIDFAVEPLQFVRMAVPAFPELPGQFLSKHSRFPLICFISSI